jgi:hypothetical protein
MAIYYYGYEKDSKTGECFGIVFHNDKDGNEIRDYTTPRGEEHTKYTASSAAEIWVEDNIPSVHQVEYTPYGQVKVG